MMGVSTHQKIRIHNQWPIPYPIVTFKQEAKLLDYLHSLLEQIAEENSTQYTTSPIYYGPIQ